MDKGNSRESTGKNTGNVKRRNKEKLKGRSMYVQGAMRELDTGESYSATQT